DTGIIVAMSIAGINRAIVDALPILEADLMLFHMEDVHDKLDLVITTVDVDLTDFSVTGFDIESLKVNTLPDTDSVQFSLGDSSIMINFEWAVTEESWPYLHDGGPGSLTASGISGIMIGQDVFDDECGLVTVEVTDVNFSYGDIELVLTGGEIFADIINVLINALTKLFADELNTLLQDGFQQALTHQFYHVIPYYRVLPDDLKQDMRVTSQFDVLDGYVAMPVTGYTYPAEIGKAYQDRPMPQPTDMPHIVTDADMQFILDQSIYGSLFTSMQLNGLLEGSVSPDEVVNPQLRSMMNTSILANICPGVYDVYPDEPVAVALTVSDIVWPEFQIMPSAGLLNITGTIEAFSGPDLDVPVLSVDCSLGLSAVPYLWVEVGTYSNATHISLDFYAYNVDVYSAHSDYGDIDLTSMPVQQTMMQLLTILSADAVAPFLTDLLVEDSPSWGSPGDFFLWDQAEFIFNSFHEGEGWMCVSIPLE
ncbi:hypothetical protein KIPB_007806, partial [Kipferlia bialata]